MDNLEGDYVMFNFKIAWSLMLNLSYTVFFNSTLRLYEHF